MYSELFLSLFPDAATLMKSQDREIFVLDEYVFKVFESNLEMQMEWKHLKICNDIYPTRYGTEAYLDESHRYIRFPRLITVTKATERMIKDVTEQIKGLNENGWMHLDVSMDNIAFDPVHDKHYLIDFGLTATYNHSLVIMERCPNYQFYKDKYRNPQGHDATSDMYALSIVAMET